MLGKDLTIKARELERKGGKKNPDFVVVIVQTGGWPSIVAGHNQIPWRPGVQIPKEFFLMMQGNSEESHLNKRKPKLNIEISFREIKMLHIYSTY